MQRSFRYECDERDVKISVRYIGACFDIQYLLSNLAASPHLLARHEQSLGIVRAGLQDGGNIEEALEELRRLQVPFEALMTELAPIPRPQDYTLFDYLYVPHLVLEALADRGDLSIQPRFKGFLPRQMFAPPGRDVSGANWLKSIKSFTSRQIRLVITSPEPERHPCLRGPSKVLAEDGIACYFKGSVFETGFVRRTALGEGKTWVYKQIAAAIESKLLRADIRICRLHGVVVDEDRDVLAHYVHVSKEELAKWDDDFESKYFDPGTNPDYSEFRKCWLKHIVGILVTYVENKGTLWELALWSDFSNEQRRRWAAEVEGLVKELHAAGLVWGDAKPHNVLVDGENRLWLIDFDGGYTEDWVDQDKKETQGGDLQGVERIKEWLVKCSKTPINRISRHS